MNTLANSSSSAIHEIELLAKKFAADRSALGLRVSHMNHELEQVKRRLIAGIKTAANQAATSRADLVAHITHHPELFEKPRSMTLHGISLGYKKGAGKLDWDSDENVVARIEKIFTKDEAELLIQVKKKPIADALRAFDGKVLAKLGVTVEATGDYVFAKGTDSEIDKLVTKILQENVAEAVEAPAS